MDRCESAFSLVANIEFRPNYPRIFPLTFSRWLEKIALHDNRSLAGGSLDTERTRHWSSW
jgi:hypothetical protein